MHGWPRRGGRQLKAAACGALGLAVSVCHTTLGAELNPGAPGTVFVRLGLAGVFFQSSAKLSIGGEPLQGADAQATNNATFLLELGAYPIEDVSIMLSLGVPPVSKFVGTGTVASFGPLGKATYGPGILSANYHVTLFGNLRPYLGAGVAYYTIFNTEDRTVHQLKVANAFAPVLQGGVEYLLAERWGLYLDLKKIWLQTRATGLAAPGGETVPVLAKATLNPLVLSAGVLVTF